MFLADLCRCCDKLYYLYQNNANLGIQMRLKMGSIVSDLAGKLGGTIFQRSPFGQVARTLYKTNPGNSKLQPTNRNNLSSIAELWKSLSTSDRDTWLANVGTYTFYDRFGDPYTPTPYQLFVHINGVLLKNEQSLTSTCDVYNTITGITATFGDMSLSGSHCTVNLSSPVPPSTFFTVQISYPYQHGNNYRYRRYIFCKSYYTLFGTSFNMFNDIITALDFTPLAGYQIRYRYQLMSSLPFGQSGWLEGTFDVVS